MATIISNSIGKVNIGGKTFHGVRNMRIEDDGRITVNGKPLEEFAEDDLKIFKIEITGNVENIETQDSDVEVNGSVGSITSHNGNVTCKDVSGNVKSANGNIVCGDVKGDATTMCGNIIRR